MGLATSNERERYVLCCDRLLCRVCSEWWGARDTGVRGPADFQTKQGHPRSQVPTTQSQWMPRRQVVMPLQSSLRSRDGACTSQPVGSTPRIALLPGLTNRAVVHHLLCRQRSLPLPAITTTASYGFKDASEAAKQRGEPF